jgi:hypothetical protein
VLKTFVRSEENRCVYMTTTGSMESLPKQHALFWPQGNDQLMETLNLMGSGCRLMELVLRLTGNGGSTTLL